MPRLVLKMSMSLDGCVARADGSGDWIAAGGADDSTQWSVDAVNRAGRHLMGATTYRVMAAYYPTATIPFTKAMNDIPKVVFSKSLTSADWGETTIETGDLAEAVTRLKEEPADGPLLAHGGTRFARALVATGLIDEYQLLVHPVVLGDGRRIFADPLDLDPTSTIAFSGGIVAHVFRARR